MTNLEILRETINQCDKEIVSAIEKRFLAVKEIIKYKKQHNMKIHQPDREKEVLEKVDSYLNNKEFSKELESIYMHIMEISKEIQKKQ